MSALFSIDLNDMKLHCFEARLLRRYSSPANFSTLALGWFTFTPQPLGYLRELVGIV